MRRSQGPSTKVQANVIILNQSNKLKKARMGARKIAWRLQALMKHWPSGSQPLQPPSPPPVNQSKMRQGKANRELINQEKAQRALNSHGNGSFPRAPVSIKKNLAPQPEMTGFSKQPGLELFVLDDSKGGCWFFSKSKKWLKDRNLPINIFFLYLKSSLGNGVCSSSFLYLLRTYFKRITILGRLKRALVCPMCNWPIKAGTHSRF